MDAMIRVRNVDFSYSQNVVFTNLNLDLPSSGLIVVTGESGSGKSTLGLMLAGHIKPDSGTIQIEGDFVGGPSQTAQYLAHSDDLFAWQTVRENFRTFANLAKTRLDPTGLIQKFGLEDLLDRYPYQLSNGQQKRASLIRALILKPRLIVLDETLSSLAKIQRRLVMTELLALDQSSKTCFIVITHHKEDLSGFDAFIIDLDEKSFGRT